MEKEIQTRLSETEKRERLDEFRAKWARHSPDCKKVNGGGQLRLGEPAIAQVSSQTCTCGLWREFEELLWILFPE